MCIHTGYECRRTYKCVRIRVICVRIRVIYMSAYVLYRLSSQCHFNHRGPFFWSCNKLIVTPTKTRFYSLENFSAPPSHGHTKCARARARARSLSYRVLRASRQKCWELACHAKSEHFRPFLYVFVCVCLCVCFLAWHSLRNSM
jgi:hypothetical protein